MRPKADAQSHSGRPLDPVSSEDRYAMGIAIATHSHLQDALKTQL
jgi:hypothetical protein